MTLIPLQKSANGPYGPPPKSQRKRLKRASTAENSLNGGPRARLEAAIANLTVRQRFETREDAIEFLRRDQPELFEALPDTDPDAVKQSDLVDENATIEEIKMKNDFKKLFEKHLKKVKAEHEKNKLAKAKTKADEQAKPEHRPLTPEELEQKVLHLVTSGSAKSRQAALRTLKETNPEFFGGEALTIADIVDDEEEKKADAEAEAEAETEEEEELAKKLANAEVSPELFVKLQDAVRRQTGCSPYAAAVAVRDNLHNGRLLKMLGREGLAYLKNVSRLPAELRKNSDGNDFQKTVAKYRASGMSGMQACRQARLEGKVA